MKKSTLLLIILLLGTLVSIGQITAMFVNDESENEQNAMFIYETLKNHVPKLVLFNAVDSARSPKTAEMDLYQLVIWYCGSDAKDLYFWNGIDQQNLALVNYLDGGGNLWLMGSGFLNDSYPFTPVFFEPQMFVYDYLGIKTWFMETYTDDGGMGLPQMDIADSNPLFTLTLETLNWEDPPEPWVDACQLTNETEGVYLFGPDSFIYSGQCGAFYCTAGDLNNLTFTFDPARLDSAGHINTLFAEIIAFYDGILAIGDRAEGKNKLLAIYPNPAVSSVNLQINMDGEISIKLFDLIGNKVKDYSINSHGGEGVLSRLSLSDLPGGLYFLRVESPRSVISKSIVISR